MKRADYYDEQGQIRCTECDREIEPGDRFVRPTVGVIGTDRHNDPVPRGDAFDGIYHEDCYGE